jgi:hypothetical protein
MNAHLRAAHHISLCPECAAEVDGHRRARAALRDSNPIRVPSALLGLLSQIPHCPPEDEPETEQNRQWRDPRARGNSGPPPRKGPTTMRGRFSDGSRRDGPEPR